MDPEELLSKLRQFREDGKYCDVIVRIQERTFRCHRVVLASVSEYFDAMFGGNFKESNTEGITLHEVDAAIFEILLTYIYTGNELKIDTNNVSGLLLASEFFGLGEVKEYCVEFIQENILSIKVSEVLNAADVINNSSLVNTLCENILNHFPNFVQKNMFLEMPYKHLNILLKRYRSSPALLKTENFLLDGLIRWIHHSFHERKRYFEELIKIVDFDRISPECAKFILKEYKINCDLLKMKDNEDLEEEPSFKKKKSRIESYTLNNYDPHPVPYQDPQSVDMMSSKLHLCLLKNLDYKVFSLNELTVEPNWIPVFTFQNYKFDALTTLVTLEKPNYIYRLDYRVVQSSTLSFQAYSSIDDFSLGNSHDLTNFPIQSKKPRICGINNGTIYLYKSDMYDNFWCPNNELPFRFSKDEYKRGIYCYNCDLDEWFPVPAMKRKLAYSTLITDNNLIYLIGGDKICGVESRYVQALDYRCSQWLKLPKTSDYFYSSQYATVGCFSDGRIYVSNGHEIQAFDSVAGRWQRITTSHSIDADKIIHMVSYKDQLYVLGKELFSVYDTASEKWSTSNSLPGVSSYNSEIFGKNMDPSSFQNVIVFKPIEPWKNCE